MRDATTFFETHGRWPADELNEYLDVYQDADGTAPDLDDLAKPPTPEGEIDAANRAIDRAQEIIIAGSLQIAASRLVGQRTQEAAGEAELFRGLQLRDEALLRRKRAYAEQLASRSKPRPRPKRRP